MLQFFCPGCRAEHRANNAFAGRKAQCVRCGAAVRIPHVSGEVGSLIPSAGSEDSDEDLDIDELAEKHALEPEPEPAAPPPAAPPAGKSLKWPKRIGFLVATALVGGLGYYFTLPGKPPSKPAAKVVPTQEEEEPPPPLDKPPEPPPAAPVVAAPPPPLEKPIVLTADRLAAEYATDSAACDRRYLNKTLEVEGLCGSFAAGRVGFQTPYAAAQGLAPTGEDAAVWAAVPLYAFTAPIREAAAAAVGPAAATALAPPTRTPRPGVGVTVRGKYAGQLTLAGGRVVRDAAPADAKYVSKTVTLTGVAATVADDVLTFELPDTATRLSVEVYFRPRPPQAPPLATAGRTVTVTGVCSGRKETAIRLDNAVVGDTGQVVPLDEFLREYETDLLAAPPADRSRPPLAVSVEELARAFQENRSAAFAKYAGKYLSVVGTVVTNQPKSRVVTFEAGTDTGFRVAAAFARPEYAKLRPDETDLGVRGVCLVPPQGRIVRLENGVAFDPDEGRPDVPRLTADYYPLTAGREWTVVRLLAPNPPPPRPDPKPGKPATKPPPDPTYAVAKLLFRTAEDGRVATFLLHDGTTTATAFDPTTGALPVKWVGKPLKNPRPVEDVRYRATEYAVEVGSPLVRPPAQPQSVYDLYSWTTLLRLGSKAGRVWTQDSEATGNVTHTAVTKFSTDARGRPTVQLETTVTNPKQPGNRQVTTSTLVKGVGLTAQKVVVHPPQGEERILYDERRVEPATPGPELRGSPTVPPRPTTPPPRESRP